MLSHISCNRSALHQTHLPPFLPRARRRDTEPVEKMHSTFSSPTPSPEHNRGAISLTQNPFKNIVFTASPSIPLPCVVSIPTLRPHLLLPQYYCLARQRTAQGVINNRHFSSSVRICIVSNLLQIKIVYGSPFPISPFRFRLKDANAKSERTEREMNYTVPRNPDPLAQAELTEPSHIASYDFK